MRVVYKTDLGIFFHGKTEDLAESSSLEEYKGKVDLIFTSPPFPLNRKKKYGNLEGQTYVSWLSSFAPTFREFIKPKGSIVIEVGNGWEKGSPTMTTFGLQALLEFLRRGEFHLCQQFIWYNPARLPTPAQWVNVERIRVKDAFTHIWWMSPSERPKANNKKVLQRYGKSMLRLLSSQKYNAGKRPSEHTVGEKSFLTNNNGAIPSNVLIYSNTKPNTPYLQYCKKNNFEIHPARMPLELPEFFINLLTKPGDLVLDPFAGSNTTGAVAEQNQRKWLAVEANEEYIRGSKGHFVKTISRQK